MQIGPYLNKTSISGLPSIILIGASRNLIYAEENCSMLMSFQIACMVSKKDKVLMKLGREWCRGSKPQVHRLLRAWLPDEP